VTKGLSSTVITDIEQVESLRSAWSDLLGRSSANEPTLSPQWMLAWWRVFGGLDRRALRVLAVHRGERLVGLAPLLSRMTSYRPRIPFRRLELLASGEDEADETCSDYLGLLADRDHEGAVADAFAEAAVTGALGAWDEIVMRSMSGTELLPSLVADALARHNLIVEIIGRVSSPYVALPATWDAYLDALPSSRRYLVRRTLRDYEAWAGAPPTLKLARSESELARAQEILHELHRERWSERGREGAFASERFRTFHATVMPELLAANALDVGSLEAHGKPVAAFYNLVWNGKSYFYQGGRKLDLPKRVRVGIVMHACLIRHAIESGYREYDFLAGMSRYKLDFALSARPLVTLRATRQSLVEAARQTAELAIVHARSLRDNMRRGFSPDDARLHYGEKEDVSE
jgi:CelD/BcsL family acetyltransferase involved in cellulose biosynthesis